MQITSPKVHLSQTIHDWHRPLRTVPYRAIIYASFSKRTPMTVYVSNKQVSSMQTYTFLYIHADIYRRSRYCLPVCWTGKPSLGCVCIKIARYGTTRKGRCQSCIVWERCTFGEVSCMQVIPFLCVFTLDGALLVPAITYHCNAVPVVDATIAWVCDEV